MISVYKIKPAFQRLLTPLMEWLKEREVTPNQITVSAIILSALIGVGVSWAEISPSLIWLVPVGLLVRMALNALDGMMARKYNQTSKVGEVLNEMGDVVSDTLIYLGFLGVPGMDTTIIFLFVLLAVVNEFAGVMGKLIGGERRYEGPMGKSDRALFIGLFSIVLFFWPQVTEYSQWIWGVPCLLIIVSTIVRIKKSLS